MVFIMFVIIVIIIVIIIFIKQQQPEAMATAFAYLVFFLSFLPSRFIFFAVFTLSKNRNRRRKKIVLQTTTLRKSSMLSKKKTLLYCLFEVFVFFFFLHQSFAQVFQLPSKIYEKKGTKVCKKKNKTRAAHAYVTFYFCAIFSFLAAVAACCTHTHTYAIIEPTFSKKLHQVYHYSHEKRIYS